MTRLRRFARGSSRHLRRRRSLYYAWLMPWLIPRRMSVMSSILYQELRRHYSEEQLIELAATAALENYRARYNRVFDVGSDGLYRKGLRFKQQHASVA